MSGSVPRWFTHLKTVTHLGTNRARRRVPTLIASNALPLRHAGTYNKGARCIDTSVFFVDDNENDDENDEIVSNFRRRD